MKFCSVLLYFVAITSFSSFAQVVTNRALMVDQDGNINIPEVLATTAQMTSNQVAIVAAEAAAREAARVAKEGTNLVNDTIGAIMANEFVVYRYGMTDSLGVMVVLPPNTLCRITEFSATPIAATADKIQLSLTSATTENADAVEPQIKHSSDITKDFDFLDTTISKSRKSGSYTDTDGNIYPYQYKVLFWVPKANAGFFTVYLDGDAADSGGMAFNIVGGITGGASSVITNGTQTLTFRGGLLTEVKDL